MGLLHEPAAAGVARGRATTTSSSTRPSRTARSPRARCASPARPRRSSCSARTSATRRSPTTTSPASSLLWALARDARRSRSSTTRIGCSGAPERSDRSAGSRATSRRSTACATASSISCVGDPGPLRYKRSRRGDAPIDRAAAHVLAREPGSVVTDWEPRGGDERQYCSPGFDLPVGTLSRTPHGLFPRVPLLGGRPRPRDARGARRRRSGPHSRSSTWSRRTRRYRNRSPYGEPQLGRRGLYQSVPDGTNPEARVALGAEPLGRQPRPARDRRALGSAVRGDPRRGATPRAARPPRASCPRSAGAGRGRHGRESGDRPGDRARAGGCRVRRRLARTVGGRPRGDARSGRAAGATAVSARRRRHRRARRARRRRGDRGTRRPDHGPREQRRLACVRSGRSGRSTRTTGGPTSDTSLGGAFNLCREVVPRMIERGEGRIVNLVELRRRPSCAVPDRIRVRQGRRRKPDRGARGVARGARHQGVRRRSGLHATPR